MKFWYNERENVGDGRDGTLVVYFPLILYATFVGLGGSFFFFSSGDLSVSSAIIAVSHLKRFSQSARLKHHPPKDLLYPFSLAVSYSGGWWQVGNRSHDASHWQKGKDNRKCKNITKKYSILGQDVCKSVKTFASRQAIMLRQVLQCNKKETSFLVATTKPNLKENAGEIWSISWYP